MSCCTSREDPIGCCGWGCPHEDDRNQAADAEREMAEAAACTCPPGIDSDECPVHEREIHMRERAREEMRP